MSEALIEVDDLSVSFRSEHGHLLRAVDDVTLRITEGEVLGLVGESGCGKTTIAKCIAGQVAPTSGVVRFEGRELRTKRAAQDRRAIQMVFQDPYSSLNPRMTVRHVLSELLRVHRLVPRADIEARCSELMALVGLPPGALDGLPSQFSGGQRQRIAIARALTVEPRVIIADEPVSALDVSVQATILQLFEDLRSRLGLTVVFISHNLAVVRHLSDRVAVMYLGRIVEQGDRESVFTDPRHPYTRALLASAPPCTRSSSSGPRSKASRRARSTSQPAARSIPGARSPARFAFATDRVSNRSVRTRSTSPRATSATGHRHLLRRNLDQPSLGSAADRAL